MVQEFQEMLKESLRDKMELNELRNTVKALQGTYHQMPNPVEVSESGTLTFKANNMDVIMVTQNETVGNLMSKDPESEQAVSYNLIDTN